MLKNKGPNSLLPYVVQAQTKCSSYDLASFHISGYIEGRAIEREP